MRRRAITRVLVPVGVVAILVSVIGVLAVSTGALAGVRADALDTLLPRGNADPRIVVVELDGAFMRRAELDPLTTYSLLVTRIADAGPGVVLVQHNVIETARVQVAGTQFALGTDAISTAYAMLTTGVLPVAVGELEAPRRASRIPVRTRPIGATPASDVARAVAADTTTAKTSGSVVRRLSLVIEVLTSRAGTKTRSAVVPSLALYGWGQLEPLRAEVSETADQLRVGNRSVPTEGNQELRISYARSLLPDGRGVITASSIVEDPNPPRRLGKKAVVIGITDPALARDLPVPVSPGRIPDVFVQANALNTLATGAFLVPDDDTVVVGAIAVLGALVALAVLLVPLWLSPVAVLLAGVGWFLFASQRFHDGHLTDLVLPLGAIASAFVLANGWRGYNELRHRRRVSGMFSQYVPQRVAEQLMDADTADDIAAGQRVIVAVLFCDLRGFTPLAAQLEPAGVRRLLDRYYECVSSLALERGGTVMQFVGDEVFAVFGAPLPLENSAAVGLECAESIVAAKPALNAKLDEDGLPPIHFGIGYHVGEVVAAHVGSTTRRQYSVVGDTVNVGSRLCGQAKADEIVLSQEALEAAGGNDACEEIGPLTLKGVERSIIGYRIRARTATTGDTPNTVSVSDASAG